MNKEQGSKATRHGDREGGRERGRMQGGEEAKIGRKPVTRKRERERESGNKAPFWALRPHASSNNPFSAIHRICIPNPRPSILDPNPHGSFHK